MDTMPKKKGLGAFRCPRCGAVTWGDINHCMECGQALRIQCEKCGARWRHIFGYNCCPKCGERVKMKRKVKS